MYDIHRGCDMVSSNDEWEHQSLAVNYAKGYGLYKLGAYSSLDDYHIDACDATFPFLRKLFTDFPTEYYHRSAGFSIITGTLYQLTDTHPYNLRVFNFILIILSWLIICFAFYNNAAYFNKLLAVLPVYIFFNFTYIDLIGDETLLIVTLSLVFFSFLKWINKPTIAYSIVLLTALLISIFIKTTLLFIPVFTLLIVGFLKLKRHFLLALGINVLLFAIILFFSKEINKRHQTYKYVNQTKFHTAMLKSDWSIKDSNFIKKYNVKFKDDVDFDFNLYKELAAYLFERQFYTKKQFLLSGQSLFLLIDGNNETCVHIPQKHIGSWMPLWKLYKSSFFYNYTEDQSAYTAIFKFYLSKPYYFPLIIYCKLYAGYHWNYLFLLLSITQLALSIFIFKKPDRIYKFILIILTSVVFHILLNQLYMTPILVFVFCITFYYIVSKLVAKKQEMQNAFQIPYYFIFYFLFLTLLMFGLNRYTCIANSMMLVALVYLWNQILNYITAAK
jgi:hypothetical protein